MNITTIFQDAFEWEEVISLTKRKVWACVQIMIVLQMIAFMLYQRSHCARKNQKRDETSWWGKIRWVGGLCMDLHSHGDYRKRPVLCHTHVTMPAFSHLSSFSTCFKYILFLMFYYFTLMYLDMDSFHSTVWDLLSFLNIQPNFIIINSSTAFFIATL